MGDCQQSANGRNVSMGAMLKLATWNCGGLSYTQRELCTQQPWVRHPGSY